MNMRQILGWAVRRPHEILFLAALVGGSLWSLTL